MTGVDLFKNWNTQEYLEELIRLTFPAASVNDIVPFQKWCMPTYLTRPPDGINSLPDTVYFAKLTNIGDGDTTTPLTLGALITLGDLSWRFKSTTDFFLFQSASASDVPFVVTGWKITLNNTIKSNMGVETPPVIAQVNGSILDPVYYYSPAPNPGGGEDKLHVSVALKGEVTKARMIYAGRDAGFGTVAAGRASWFIDLAGIQPVLPFEIKLTGYGVIGGNDVAANEIRYSVTGKVAHCYLSSWRYQKASLLPVEFYFRNIDPLATISITITDTNAVNHVFNVPLGRTDFTCYCPAVAEPASGTTWAVKYTPTVSGVQCLFIFNRVANW